MFDAYDMTDSDCTVFYHHASDGNLYNAVPGNAYMIESDKIDGFTSLPLNFKVEEMDNSTSIVSPVSAAEILCDIIIDGDNFDVQEVSLVYRMYKTSENQFMAFPCWKFRTFNENTESSYSVFVNAFNGDVHFYAGQSLFIKLMNVNNQQVKFSDYR